MRFISPEDVQHAAEVAANADMIKHMTFGVDLNPYCTNGARACWQRGFEGLSRNGWDTPLEWDFRYQRGAAAARLYEVLNA